MICEACRGEFLENKEGEIEISTLEIYHNCGHCNELHVQSYNVHPQCAALIAHGYKPEDLFRARTASLN